LDFHRPKRSSDGREGDGCSEKLDIYIRYSQRDEWLDIGFMPRKLISETARER